jgi:Cu/Ag efflux protein CusF
MINTRINENYNANDVLNPNDLRKRILNIDSRFGSESSKSTTDFTFQLDHTYKNIIRLRIASIEIPNMMYTFTVKNNSFTIKAYDKLNIARVITIEIPVGNYTSCELMDKIQSVLDTEARDKYGICMTITLDTLTAKVTITHTGVLSVPVTDVTALTPGKPFILDFKNNARKHNFGLGYNLGFRKKTYKVTTVTGECCLDVVGDTYMFLCINDLHTVEQKTDENYIQCLAKIIIREDRYAVIYDDGSTLMANEIVFPSPTDLKILQVKLIDAYGDVIDLNCMNFSFSLEITEVLNTSLYDFYRNYIWLGTIPSIKKPSGSQQQLLRGVGP